MINLVGILSVTTALLMATPIAAPAATLQGAKPSVPSQSVVDLHMFNPESGVALVPMSPATAEPHRYRYAIVRTVNGGIRWNMTGSLPLILTRTMPTGGLNGLLSMAFATPSKGYVSLIGSRHAEFTTDGGRTWSILKISDPISAITFEDQSLWIITTDCQNKNDNPSLCSSGLVVYPFGHRAPEAMYTVPTTGPVLTSGVHSKTFQATLWSRRSEEGLFSEGGEGLRSTLLETLNAGGTWAVVIDPCTQTSIAGLVQRDAANWVLYCNLDGGMHQGYNELWSTTDAGQHWVLVGEGSEQGSIPTVGNIGDGMTDDLTVSGNGHELWMLGSVDGIVESADGGTNWQETDLQTGGYPGDIVTAGPIDAWLALPGIGLYRTVNGTTWSRLG
jgi:photosystem II stability/assembly factor-like uncharacterized protein